MKLSTKGRYGLKAMVDLATEYDSGARLSIAQLAERQGVSAAYLEQLIASLKKAGLVTALRGVQGGYVLARSPELISVGNCRLRRHNRNGLQQRLFLLRTPALAEIAKAH